jgi:nucleotide-binding universal stress UspA family protein
MSFKTICITVTDAASDSYALAVASALTAQEDAHLHVSSLGVDALSYATTPFAAGGVPFESGLAEAKQQADQLLAWARTALPVEAIKVSGEAIGLPQLAIDPSVAQACRYADLIIAAKPYGKGHTALQAAVLEAGLFGTDTLTLVVPDRDMNFQTPFSRMMIAWNDTDEALAAVRRSLPFLIKAQQVDIVCVDPHAHGPERSDPGGAISLFLSRHGVRPEISVLARSLPKVSDVLLRFAREHDVDALVMGAYSHSRFRESLLGGVTRDVLEKLEIPVLMAH